MATEDKLEGEWGCRQESSWTCREWMKNFMYLEHFLLSPLSLFTGRKCSVMRVLVLHSIITIIYFSSTTSSMWKWRGEGDKDVDVTVCIFEEFVNKTYHYERQVKGMMVNLLASWKQRKIWGRTLSLLLFSYCAKSSFENIWEETDGPNI